MTYELRPLSFGELLDTGFRIFRDHFGVLFGLAAVAYAPLALISMLMNPLTAGAPGAVSPLSHMGGAALVGAILLTLFVLVAWPMVTAAISFAVGELYLGRPAGVRPSLRLGFSILLPLSGTVLLQTVFTLGASLLLVVPGLYLMLAYAVAWPVMAIERVFGMQALRRSRALMRGSKRRVLAIWLVAAVIVMAPSSLLGFALHAYPMIATLASHLVNAAGGALISTFVVVLYFDARCRQEAFDIEHLADLVAQRAEVRASA